MSAPRYERVSQTDDNISLVSLGNYNYMSGVPSSPPPSFHSTESIADRDGDLTPTHSTPLEHSSTNYNDSASSRRMPPPPSVIGSTTDSEAVILNLHKRIEQLEETIGRLLLEKESLASQVPSSSYETKGGNCCVSFSSSEPSAAELGALRGGGNCCVSFGRGSKQSTEQDRRLVKIFALIFGVLVLVAMWTILLQLAKSRGMCKPEMIDGSER